MRSSLGVLGLLAAVAAPASGQESRTLHGRCTGGYASADLGFAEVRCDICLTSREGAFRFAAEPEVRSPSPHGPAHGVLRDGDVLVTVNDQLITTHAGTEQLRLVAPGETIRLGIRRSGRDLTVSLVAGTRCSAAQTTLPFALSGGVPTRPAADSRPAGGDFGVTFWCTGRCGVATPTGDREWLFSAPPRIAFVRPGSPAEALGLRVDDVIVEVNGLATATPEGTARFLALSRSTPAAVTVVREAARMVLRGHDD